MLSLLWKGAVVLVIFAWTSKVSLYHAKKFLQKHPQNFLNYLKKRKDGKDKATILLVTAHPDDECMFFTPAIRCAINAGWNVHLLCFTTGNADGLGVRRTAELKASAKHLGISKTTIINDESKFPDSMKVKWDTEWVASKVVKYLDDYPTVSTVITFDQDGVSGHSNHKDVCQGVRLALEQLDDDHLQLIELESLPLSVKYIGIIGIIYEAVNVAVDMTLNRIEQKPSELLVCWLDWSDYIKYSVGAMLQHKSQLVWFRWLYLAFSCYCHANSLKLKMRN